MGGAYSTRGSGDLFILVLQSENLKEIEHFQGIRVNGKIIKSNLKNRVGRSDIDLSCSGYESCKHRNGPCSMKKDPPAWT